ncbi:hypothetical protein BH23ACT5_BH23ACT5_18300 [soil metagenome]
MPAPKQTRRLTTFMTSLAVLIATPLIVVATDTFGDVADTKAIAATLSASWSAGGGGID